MRLSRRTWAVAADGAPAPGARGCRRRRHRRRADDLEPVAVGERQLVGQVERDHLGVDQVVAVVAHAGDPQRAGSAWRGRARYVTAAALGQPAPRPRRRAPRPGPRAARRRPRTRLGVDEARQRPPQHLAALAEPGPHQRRTAASGSTSTRRRRPPHDATPARTRPWAAGTNTVGGTCPTTSRRGPVRHLHRRRRRRRRRPRRAASRSPTSRCTITSIRSIGGTPSSRSSTSGVATLYGRLATSVHRGRRPSSAGQSSVHGVALDHRHARRARPPPAAPARGGGRSRRRSPSRRSRPAPASASRGRRRSRPRGRPARPGQPGDAAHRVGVGDEVLAEGPARARSPCPRPARSSDLAGPGERHQVDGGRR